MAGGTIHTKQKQSDLVSTLKDGLVGGGIGAALGLALFFIGGAVLGPLEVALQPGAPPAPLTWTMFIVASLVPAVGAAVLLYVLRRFTVNGTRIFQAAAVLFLLLSLVPPLTQATNTAVGVFLTLVHVVVGGSIIWALTLRQG